MSQPRAEKRSEPTVTSSSISRDLKSAITKPISKAPIPAPPPFKARAYTKPHFDTPLSIQRKKCDSASTKNSSNSPTPSATTTQSSIASILDSVFARCQTPEPELKIMNNTVESNSKSYNSNKYNPVTKYNQAFNRARNKKPASVIKEAKVFDDEASSTLSSILASLSHSKHDNDLLPPPPIINSPVPDSKSHTMPKYSATIRSKIAARLASRKVYPRSHMPTEEELAARAAHNQMSTLLTGLLASSAIEEELDDEDLLVAKEQELLEFNSEDHRGSVISEINARDPSKISLNTVNNQTPDKVFKPTTPNNLKNVIAKHSELAAKTYLLKKPGVTNNKQSSNAAFNLSGPLSVKMSPRKSPPPVRSNVVLPHKSPSSVSKSTTSTIAKISTPQTTATVMPASKPQEALVSGGAKNGEANKTEEKQEQQQQQPAVVTTEMNTTPRASRAVISFFINEFD